MASVDDGKYKVQQDRVEALFVRISVLFESDGQLDECVSAFLLQISNILTIFYDYIDAVTKLPKGERDPRLDDLSETVDHLELLLDLAIAVDLEGLQEQAGRGEFLGQGIRIASSTGMIAFRLKNAAQVKDKEASPASPQLARAGQSA